MSRNDRLRTVTLPEWAWVDIATYLVTAPARSDCEGPHRLAHRLAPGNDCMPLEPTGESALLRESLFPSEYVAPGVRLASGVPR